MIQIRFILLLTLAATGCQMFQRKTETRIVTPKLSMEMSRDELIEHLNAQSDGLKSWRCNDTVVEANVPKFPDQRLKGTFHCAWPSHFRLDAGNMVGVHANLGSNNDICWAFMQPGEPMVLTWKHEDAYLLQYIPDGIPRLEPEWLLTILGVNALDPNRYKLTSAPEGSRELWLAAIETAPDGSSLRRVIKVDTVAGVAREHALYDRDRNLVLRAQLKDHKTCGRYRLPHTVMIDFPANKTRLTLRFKNIQTDCELNEGLWMPPHSSQYEYLDIGDMIRREMPIARETQDPVEALPTGDSKFIEDPDSQLHADEVVSADDPFFEHELSGKTDQGQTSAQNRPLPPPRRRSFFSNPFRRRSPNP